MSYLNLHEYQQAKNLDAKSVSIFWFNENTSHNGILQQVVEKLVEAGFASEQEIKETWFDLLQAELKK